MRVTIQVAFKCEGEQWWTVIERECEAADIESIAASTSEAVRHAKHVICKDG